MFLKNLFVYLFFLFVFISCKESNLHEQAYEVINNAGNNESELKKVIEHYKLSKEPLKLKAAYFLIANMDRQFYYSGEKVDSFDKVFKKMDSIIFYSPQGTIEYSKTWDSLQESMPKVTSKLFKVMDKHVIKADILIDNIDRSFVAWKYPWANSLTFEEFSKYILPYKLKNEKPEKWRGHFQEKYKWLLDSLKFEKDPMKASKLINQELKRTFYFTRLNCPFHLSASQLNHINSGRCPEQVQYTTYAMRAMGIPVAMDKVPYWANRNANHDWNVLYNHKKMVPFLGTEIDPGLYKLDFVRPGSFKSKKAKIWRRSVMENPNTPSRLGVNKDLIPEIFHDPYYEDVTKEYIKTSNLIIKIDHNINIQENIVYLCVFNSLEWKPISWSIVKYNKVVFNDMGRDVIYLPAILKEGIINPISLPIRIDINGKVETINYNKEKTFKYEFLRKYPSGDDNLISKGDTYELYYWDNYKWQSLGTKMADKNCVSFGKIPSDGLYWLRDISRGMQERIFTIENNKLIWW